MKRTLKLVMITAPLLGVLAAGLPLAASVHAMKSVSRGPSVSDQEQDEVRELDPRCVVPAAKISLSKAVSLALEIQPGAAVEAGLEGELDGERPTIFYEIMIVGVDKRLHEVKLSHLDGKLIQNGLEEEAEEAHELIGFNEALRHSELTLSQLIASARRLVSGSVASASLGLDESGPECEVLVVNGRYLVEVDVEARAGHIVEVELVGLGREDEDECRYCGGDGDEEGASRGVDDDQVSKGHHDDDEHDGDEEGDEDDD